MQIPHFAPDSTSDLFNILVKEHALDGDDDGDGGDDDVHDHDHDGYVGYSLMVIR